MRDINSFLFGRSFLRMLFINAKALFMRFYVLSMNFLSMCLNIALRFFSVSFKQILHKEFHVCLTQSTFLLHKSKSIFLFV